MRAIFLMILGLSSLVLAQEATPFTKTSDIVTDSRTTLQWQDNVDSNSTVKSWEEAIAYCEDLTLESYSDWRLPNVNELKSIVDRTKKQPAIDTAFEYVTSAYYWSSTTNLGYKNQAMQVSFLDGRTDRASKAEIKSVRCVRNLL